MQTTWVVLADEGRARILEMRESGTDLADVEEITDAAAHADNADLRRDAYGRRGGGSAADAQRGGSTTTSAGEDKLDHEAELFARRVAQLLREAHQKGRFERLRIAAAPKFLGRLRKQLDQQESAVVDEELDKDLLQLSARELTRKFFH